MRIANQTFALERPNSVLDFGAHRRGLVGARLRAPTRRVHQEAWQRPPVIENQWR